MIHGEMAKPSSHMHRGKLACSQAAVAQHVSYRVRKPGQPPLASCRKTPPLAGSEMAGQGAVEKSRLPRRIEVNISFSLQDGREVGHKDR
jgi:hypothetical protein